MAQRNRNKNFKNSNKSRSKSQSNNYQDMAEEREFKKGFNKGRGSKDKLVPVNTGARYDNDPEWYALNPLLLKDAARFPFSTVSGYPINVPKGDETRTDIADNYLSVNGQTYTPGILVIRTGSALGTNRSSTDPAGPLTVAINALYAFIRKANSGAQNYDPNFVAAYVLAMSDAYAFYSWMVRAYGVMTQYSATNAYMPRRLVGAMGLDFDSLKDNLADFRMLINQFAFQLQSRALPKAITYTTRHIWMYENVYKDSNSDTGKEQLYLFNPIGFMKLNETANPMRLELTSPNGKPEALKSVVGAITPIGNPGTRINLVTLSQYANSLIEPIMASADFGTLSGDMTKAFGDGAMMSVLGISETYTVRPVYSQEVLTQIENSNSVDIAISGTTGYPRCVYNMSTQIGSSLLIQNHSILHDVSDVGMGRALVTTRRRKHLINMHKTDVTPEEFMVATRLTTGGLEPQSDTNLPENWTAMQVTNMASDYVLDYVMYYYNKQMDNNIATLGTTNLHLYNEGAIPTAQQALYWTNHQMQYLAWLSHFDWCPKMQNVDMIVNDSGLIVKGSYGSDFFVDLDNYTTITDEELERLNRVAMISLLSARDMD